MWWNDELSQLWNNLCEAQLRWRRAFGVNKSVFKSEMAAARRVFDRAVQNVKRRHWQDTQRFLLDSCKKGQKVFWKTIGKIGVGSQRKDVIPWEIVGADGDKRDKTAVLNKWKEDFCGLLNPVSNVVDNPSLPEHLHNVASVNTGYNQPIGGDEIWAALARAKNGKAFDQLTVEVLRNRSAVKYMHSLFNFCFDNSIMPTAWTKGVINPIPKARDPLSYRGITLASAMYKLFCGVLNHRIGIWSETNGLILDEQNGFRKGRSCLEHLSTLTCIAETRLKHKQSTFITFVDFSKAYDRIDRRLLWVKLQQLGMQGKML